jgi:DNA-directed RNA polymerase subunit RPC12/RpoP
MIDANLTPSKQASVPSPDQIETAGVQVTERDIVFECPHCGGELAVDMDGAGIEVNCAHCGSKLVVPEYHGPSLQFLQTATSKLAKAIQAARNATPKKYQFEGLTSDELKLRQNELQRVLRETQTQVTEVKGHIHHATIQLHRYQLRLEVIQERQSELKAELDALTQALKPT